MTESRVQENALPEFHFVVDRNKSGEVSYVELWKFLVLRPADVKVSVFVSIHERPIKFTSPSESEQTSLELISKEGYSVACEPQLLSGTLT